MGQTVSVDVKHSLGVEEAQKRVQAGLEALKQKYADKLSALTVDWSDARADLAITVMGHSLKGALEFFPEVVRVSLELPWVLAMVAEKAKGMLTREAENMLRLPPPPKA